MALMDSPIWGPIFQLIYVCDGHHMQMLARQVKEHAEMINIFQHNGKIGPYEQVNYQDMESPMCLIVIPNPNPTYRPLLLPIWP